MIIVVLIPIWTFTYFPSQDGPIHLWILHLGASYNSSGAETLGKFIVPNTALEPNLGFYLIAYPLSLIFRFDLIERLFLTIYTLIFCYGARYAIAQVNGHATFLSFLAIPMAIGYFSHMGFYNYSIGMALFLPTIAYWCWQYTSKRPFLYFKIAMTSFLLVVFHLVIFAAAVFTFGVYVVSLHAFQLLGTEHKKIALGSALRNMMWLTVSISPALFVFFSFALRHGVTSNPTSVPIDGLLSDLVNLRFLFSFELIELWWLARPLAAILISLTVFAIPALWRRAAQAPTAAATLTAAFALLFLYVATPITSKDVAVNARLAPAVALLGLLVIAHVDWRRYVKVLVITVCGAIIFGEAFIRYQQYSQYNLKIQSFVSLSSFIRPGSTILPIRLENINYISTLESDAGSTAHRPGRANPLLHAGAHLAIMTEGIYLKSTLMSRSHFGYFPYIYRDELDPFASLGIGIDHLAPDIDFSKFEAVTGQPVDYLVITARLLDDSPTGGPEIPGLMAVLATSYQRVASTDDGWHHLYEAK